MKALKLKVCGMRESQNILDLAALRPDFMGFIFYAPSKRYALPLLEAKVLASLPTSIIKTGVFVNEQVSTILELVQQFHLQAVQLHGKESVADCGALKKQGLLVIKVFHVDAQFNWQSLEPYEGVCDYYLFDTADAAWGGTGKTFDWSVLKNYTSHKPYFLSGGLSEEHLPLPQELLNTPLEALDINSRFEERPGYKNIALVKAFQEKLNR